MVRRCGDPRWDTSELRRWANIASITYPWPCSALCAAALPRLTRARCCSKAGPAACPRPSCPFAAHTVARDATASPLGKKQGAYITRGEARQSDGTCWPETASAPVQCHVRPPALQQCPTAGRPMEQLPTQAVRHRGIPTQCRRSTNGSRARHRDQAGDLQPARKTSAMGCSIRPRTWWPRVSWLSPHNGSQSVPFYCDTQSAHRAALPQLCALGHLADGRGKRAVLDHGAAINGVDHAPAALPRRVVLTEGQGRGGGHAAV